jgi:peptidoglycan/xylan/chitin deacetylase (PgdA/CDA1 family)
VFSVHRKTKRAALLAAIVIALAIAPLVPPAVLDRPEAVDPEPVTAIPGSAEPVIYLTFDAGNAPSHTVAPLLDLLDREGVRATFFLTGRWTVRHPQAARAIADAGHELANHSFNHPHMNRWPAAIQHAEVWWTGLVIRVVCGREPTRLYRPPHGDTDLDTEEFLASKGFRTVMWSKDPSDWRLDGSVTVDSIRTKIEPLGNGDIVCFHLRNIETVDALVAVLPGLHRDGMTFPALDAGSLLAASPARQAAP